MSGNPSAPADAPAGAGAAGAGAASAVGARAALRLRALDNLLPGQLDPPPGCGLEITATGPGGRPAAIGICTHWASEPGSFELTWGAARRFQLTTQVAGPDVGTALDELLSQWRYHLADVPGTHGADTAAIVHWPSLDTEGVLALLAHGFTPFAVVAARPTAGVGAGHADESARSRSSATDAGGGGQVTGPGVRIRRAAPADLDEVVRLGLEVVRFDAHFGAVSERPETEAALRREAAELLASPEPWVWLAERDEAAIGLLAAERPERTGWIAPLVRHSPVAYLMLMFVQPGARGSGNAAALTSAFHRDVARAGVPVTLLHYEQVNPLSAPFWSRQGYRPLWTSWEAWPASAVR